jgi:hypothetical protein
MARSFVVVFHAAAILSLSACTDATSEEEAEAEAEAAADGKTDQLAFPLGHYLPVDDYYDEGNERLPLIAAFHAKDAGVPATDHGHFDLVRYDGDYGSTYASGTFKVYKWQGRDRIRFTTYAGRVIWRTDWGREDNKLVLDGHGMYQPNRLEEELVDCLAVDVLDNNVFEESLSTWEYPSVSVSKDGDDLELSIGSSSFTPDEAEITLEQTAGELVARAQASEGAYSLHVSAKSPRRGEIRFQETDGEQTTIAKVVCR